MNVRQLRKAVLAMGFEIRQGAKHEVVFDPKTGRNVTVIPRTMAGGGRREKNFMAHLRRTVQSRTQEGRS
jgi:hypothetical protein